MGEVCVLSCVGLDVGLPDLSAVEEMISNAVAQSVCCGTPAPGLGSTTKEDDEKHGSM